MSTSSAEENYFTEEGLEKSTESLMRKLEHARDPESFEKRFRGHSTSRAASSASDAASTSDGAQAVPTLHPHPLLVTALAILVGSLAGFLLCAYLL